MPVDLESVSPEARLRYIAIGRRYKTPSVLAQAEQSVRALEEYAPIVAQHGFGSEDQGQLIDAHVLLQSRQDDQAQAVAQRSITSQTYGGAIKNGKEVRQSARATLEMVDKSATERSVVDVATLVRTVLRQTSALPEDKLLLDQLSILHTGITTDIVQPFVVTRGGPELVLRLESARDNLRAAQGARAGHTPVTSVSEERDILDGMVVSLARSARNAAKAAARHLGQPSIAAAFKLTHLRRASGGAARKDPESPPPGGNDDAPITQPGAPVTSDK